MFHWMIDCRAVTQIVSEAMDRPLPLRRQLWMWIHLMMCGRCAAFRKQIWLLRSAAAAQPPDEKTAEKDVPRLSEDARSRLKTIIHKHCLGK